MSMTDLGTKKSTEAAAVIIEGKEYQYPVITGTENEKAIDISKLRAQTGYITLDDGFKNTGSCESSITFIDGEAGILRYRGIPIEELAETSNFLECAYLIIFGYLPKKAELDHFADLVADHTPLHEDAYKAIQGFSPGANPMGVLSGMLNVVAGYVPPAEQSMKDPEVFKRAVARLLGKTASIASATFRKATGRPMMNRAAKGTYAENFMYQMFAEREGSYTADPDVARALDLILLLHADHEQNCSTSTVRMVGSSQANLYASVSAGVCALWGPLHGGANIKVVEMLQTIKDSGATITDVINRAKDKNSNFRLFGFGHRVYKNFDPRSRILKQYADIVLGKMGEKDPLLEIAVQLEEVALRDSYFVERKLYPNVDFYSGIIMRAMGIPTDLFTVMFAMGRMPGWIANWKEVFDDPNGAIYRPRQVYQGPTLTHYTPVEKR